MSVAKAAPDWIPRLCTTLGLLRTVLLSLVVSCLLAVLRHGLAGLSPLQFGPLALLVLWLTLFSAFWLCLLHNWQFRFKHWSLAVTALAGIVIITGFSSWAFNTWVARSGGTLPLASVAENMLIAFLIAAVILRFLAVHSQLQHRDHQLGQARFDALQARIRPHFLFNTLNSIAALIRQEPRKAEDALLDLSDMMRSSLGRENRDWTLGDEVDICRKYLAIEKLRMGERLDWDIQVEPQAMSLNFPQLALQPLVENAVLHGIQSRPGGGTLGLKVDYRDSVLSLELRNPVAEHDGHAGSGQALSNIEARLDTFFGGRAHLEHQPEGDDYLVRLVVEVEA